MSERITLWTKVSVLATVVATIIAGIALFMQTDSSNQDRKFSWDSIIIEDARYATKFPFHNVTYPRLQNLPDPQLEPKINSLLKRAALDVYRDYDDEFTEVKIQYEVKYIKYGLLGIQYITETYGKGAAHPLLKSSAFSINLETGNSFEFKDLFISKSKETINNVVSNYLKENDLYHPCEGIAEDDMVRDVLESILHTSARGCFSGVADYNDFYITDSEVVVVFPQYMISGGADGIIEVPIPLTDVKELINKNGPLRLFF